MRERRNEASAPPGRTDGTDGGLARRRMASGLVALSPSRLSSRERRRRGALWNYPQCPARADSVAPDKRPGVIHTRRFKAPLPIRGFGVGGGSGRMWPAVVRFEIRRSFCLPCPGLNLFWNDQSPLRQERSPRSHFYTAWGITASYARPMRLRRPYAATHALCSYTRPMQLRTPYAATHTLCSYAHLMQLCKPYAATHTLCSYTRPMELRTPYAATQTLCSYSLKRDWKQRISMNHLATQDGGLLQAT